MTRMLSKKLLSKSLVDSWSTEENRDCSSNTVNTATLPRANELLDVFIAACLVFVAAVFAALAATARPFDSSDLTVVLRIARMVTFRAETCDITQAPTPPMTLKVAVVPALALPINCETEGVAFSTSAHSVAFIFAKVSEAIFSMACICFFKGPRSGTNPAVCCRILAVPMNMGWILENPTVPAKTRLDLTMMSLAYSAALSRLTNMSSKLKSGLPPASSKWWKVGFTARTWNTS